MTAITWPPEVRPSEVAQRTYDVPAGWPPPPEGLIYELVYRDGRLIGHRHRLHPNRYYTVIGQAPNDDDECPRHRTYGLITHIKGHKTTRRARHRYRR